MTFPIAKETNGALLNVQKMLLLGYMQIPQLLFAEIDLK